MQGITRRQATTLLAGPLLLAAFHSVTVQAQTPITENDFNIDLYTGPILGGGRAMGMGGAYTAIAEGLDGAPWNPAAYGSRTLWQLKWFEWEITGSLMFPGGFASNDFYNSGTTEGFAVDRFLFVTLGARLQFGDVGVGFLPQWRTFTLDDGTGSPVDVTFNQGHAGFAYQLHNGQIVIGGGWRFAKVSLRDANNLELVSTSGNSAELGVLVRYEDQPWRLGVATKTPVATDADNVSGLMVQDGVSSAGGLVLPRRAYMPWELQVGFAYQFGDRPLNQRWVDPQNRNKSLRQSQTIQWLSREHQQWMREQSAAESPLGSAKALDDPRSDLRSDPRGNPQTDQVQHRLPSDPYAWSEARPQSPSFWKEEKRRREEELKHIDEQYERDAQQRREEMESIPRFYVLLSTEILLTGKSSNAIDPEAFLLQRHRRSGTRNSFAYRFGAETEPLAHRLKIRAGTYLEPARIEGATSRGHFTAGTDLRLFTWDVFGLFQKFDIRVSGLLDAAPRYFNWGVSVGVWH